MADQIAQTGIAPDGSGRLTLVYLDQNGQKQRLDLTAAIEEAAAAAVKRHEKDYHGGFD
jgi:hypothetical protein